VDSGHSRTAVNHILGRLVRFHECHCFTEPRWKGFRCIGIVLGLANGYWFGLGWGHLWNATAWRRSFVGAH
jgi:hypothetical protein